MRGFFTGVVSGLVVVGAGVVTLSVLLPVLPKPDVSLQVPEAPQPISPNKAKPAVDPGAVDPDVAQSGPVDPGDPDIESDSLHDVAVSQERPESQPAIGTDPEVPLSPPAPEPAPKVQAPVTESESAVAVIGAGSFGTPDKEVLVQPDTAVPEAPEVTEEIRAAEPPLTGTAPEIAVPSTVKPSTEAPDIAAPASDGFPDAAMAHPADPQVIAAPADRANPDGQDAGDPIAGSDSSGNSPPESETPAEATPAPRIAALPQAGVNAASPVSGLGNSVVPFTERDRASGATDAASGESGQRPIERFAAPFENPDGKPLMSIVLIDDDQALGVEALAEFPYPLTFAIDPSRADAADRMARHRDAGFEVVALVDLPRAATAQDAEVMLAAGFSTLTEAVGVLEGTGTGIQGNRALSSQVAAVAKATGRGLITQDAGLNTAYKLAVRDGVPAAVVFRDFDGVGQDPTVMRRFLDQAAFRAGQDGDVVMMGRVRPDTISALLLWGLQDRAGRVALAPLSALLRQSVSTQ